MRLSRYVNGKIYVITGIDARKCYIGTTTELISQRLAKHRAQYKKYKEYGGKYKPVYEIFDEFGDGTIIELIEFYPCNSKAELDKHKNEYIRNCECVNKHEYMKMEVRNKPVKGPAVTAS